MWPRRPNVEKLERKKDVEGLSTAVRHSDPAIIRDAFRAVLRLSAEMNDTSVLWAVADHPDPTLGLAALQAIMKLKADSPFDAIGGWGDYYKIVNHPDPIRSAAAVQALVHLSFRPPTYLNFADYIRPDAAMDRPEWLDALLDVTRPGDQYRKALERVLYGIWNCISVTTSGSKADDLYYRTLRVLTFRCPEYGQLEREAVRILQDPQWSDRTRAAAADFLGSRREAEFMSPPPVFRGGH